MAGDGRTGEFDNGGDVNLIEQPEQHELFVVVVFVFDNAGSADADDGDLPRSLSLLYRRLPSFFLSFFSSSACLMAKQSSNVDHRFMRGGGRS